MSIIYIKKIINCNWEKKSTLHTYTYTHKTHTDTHTKQLDVPTI